MKPPALPLFLLAYLMLLIPAANAAPAQQPIRILSWNVLAPSPWKPSLSFFGIDSDADRRSDRLLKQIAQQNPDLIALQEVRTRFLERLSNNPQLSRYRIAAQGSPPASGLVILSRHPITDTRYQRLPGQLGRGVLYATVAIGEQRLVIANVHLESPLDANDTRRTQMQLVDDRMPWAEWQVWAGDFNFGDQGPEQGLPVLSRWIDVWRELKPGQAGYSYDLSHNPLATEHAYGNEPSRRLDRILVSPTLQPVAIRLIGTGNAPASDHYGVVTDLLIPVPTTSPP
jgi:endonuclease/exonuclease/phosphatase family metal-dependent hydrolase